MADQPDKPHDWYSDGLTHLWSPYAQMKTLAPPLSVARTEGTRIVLTDGESKTTVVTVPGLAPPGRGIRIAVIMLVEAANKTRVALSNRLDMEIPE